MTSALYSSILAKVVLAIREAAFLHSAPLAATSRFEEDLELDGADVAEVLVHIEEVFHLEFTAQAITAFRCIGDVADYLSQRFFRDVECEPLDTFEALAA